MDEIAIILADDHEIFRNGLKQLIDKEKDMKVVAEASSGTEVLELINEMNPDIVILDIRMPGLNGLEVAETLISMKKESKIIIFSLYDNEEYVVQALNIGACGFLLKDTSNKIFLEAIRSVNKGINYYIGAVSDVVIRHLRSLQRVDSSGVSQSMENTSPTGVQLSKRENEILDLIIQGNNSKQTADELGVSVRTVDAHRLNILRKYGVNSMDEVLAGRKTQS